MNGSLASEREMSDERYRSRVQFELYYHPLSTYCQKVLVAIHEKGARYKPHIVDLMNPESRDEYRELYPMGKVPLIVLNHGPLIPESSIIIEYLDGLGGPRMISTDPDVARKTRFKDRFIDLYLSDSVGTLFFENRKPAEAQDAQKIETSRYRIKAAYDFLEYEISDQTWANGEDFSMSDCAAAAALLYAPDVAPYDDYPSISSYAERLSARDSVRQAREEAAPYIERMNAASG